MIFSKREKGALAEESAAAYLKKNGYKLLERNYRSLFGEIDIIAGFKDTIVFVEVKFRSSDSFGAACEAVNTAKRRKIVKTALQYIKKEKLRNRAFRFDIISIEPDGSLEHLVSAFEPPGKYTI